jgi:hypothetical protein
LNGRFVPIPDAPDPADIATVPPEGVAPLRFQTLDFGPRPGPRPGPGRERERRACIRGIDVFVVDSGSLPAQKTAASVDRFAEGASLFDFADEDAPERRGLEAIADQCGLLLAAQAEAADPAIIEALVRILDKDARWNRCSIAASESILMHLY